MRNCEVCGRDTDLPPSCSSLGAISFVTCQPCIQMAAEPLWMMHCQMDILAGDSPDRVDDLVADWVKDLTSWSEGVYIEWEDIKRLWTPDPIDYEAETKTEPKSDVDSVATTGVCE